MARPKRILIVEDNVNTSDYLAELLHVEGYQTDWAVDREQVFEKLRGLRVEAAGVPASFDLVLLDLMLSPGGVEGFDICRRIKNDDALRHLAVIMVTGLGSTANKTKGLELGADDYVTKPFIPEELLARIRAALRVRSMEQAVLQHNRELTALNDLARLTSSTLNLDEVLAASLNQTLTALAGQSALIAWADQAAPARLAVRIQRGIPLQLSERMAAAHWSVQGGVIGIGRGLDQAAICTDLDQDAYLSLLVPVGFYAAACTPLWTQQRVVGALIVLSPDGEQWGEQTLRLLEAIGRQVGMAAENARLYTQVSQYAAELARSQERLVQAEKLAAMGRLTIYIAHELNNPLQAIQNCLHLVLHRNLDAEKRQKYLAMAQEEVERLIKTVQRMLDFNRGSVVQQQPTDVHQVIEGVLSLAGKRLQRGRVRVRREFFPNLPPIQANADQLKQVFLNLVLNAAEAMPDGGDLTISTGLDDRREWAWFSFQDQGVGLSAEVMSHIFEPFFTTKSQGTGVGLAISCSLIEQHGGAIDVSSTVGQGSRFVVKLPIHPAQGG